MRKIVLMCALGVTTSLMVERIKEAAAAENYPVEVNAYPVATAKEHKDADIILLGPQVRFDKEKVQQSVGDIPVVDIDLRAYGMMDGKAVLAQVKTTLGD